MDKKETFKQVIVEFWEQTLPQIYPRELKVPISTKKVVVIWGPRRSGKSFYLYSLVQKLRKENSPESCIIYVNFEDDRLLPLKGQDLQQLLEAYWELYPENKDKKVYFFLDEIQAIYGWEAFVRRLHEREKAQVFVTGSSSKLLSREIATSLRGRCISYGLFPLSFSEFLDFKGLKREKNFEYGKQRFKVKKLLSEYLVWGRFPEVALEDNEVIKKKILQEYFQALVHQDLAERFSMENTVLLREFLKYLFTNITGLFSVNSYYKLVSQTMPVAKDTVFSYFDNIEESYYLSFLPIFAYSLKKQRVNPKKILALDSGLRKVVGLQFSPDWGKLAENLVGKLLLESEAGEVFYWKNKHEVDFIVRKGREVEAINVSYVNKLASRETEGLLEFKDRHKRIRKLVVITKDIEEERNNVQLLPLWKWLLGFNQNHTN